MKRQLLEDIIKGVQERGYYDVSLVMLETILNQGDRRRPQTKREVLLWAKEKQIDYEYREGEDGELIRFFRP